MKNIIIISILFLGIIHYCQAQNDKTELDSLYNMIGQLDTRLKFQNQKIDSLEKLSIKNELTLELKGVVEMLAQFKPSKKTFTDEMFPILIPVLIALFGAFAAILQIRTQTRYSLIHSRSNKITEARLEWNKDLRNVFSKLLRASTILHFHMRTISDIIAERNTHNKSSKDYQDLHQKAEAYYQSHIELINEFIVLTSEVQLYLDAKEGDKKNKLHSELENILEQYIDSVLDYKEINDVSKFNSVANALITKGREILNNSWSKARIEGDIEITKAYNESFFWKKIKKANNEV